MRVVIVLTQALEPTSGGVQMATVKLARMLTRRGHEVKVFSFAHGGHAQHDDVSLVIAPEPRGEGNAENISALTKLLSVFDPHIVINQMPYLHGISDALEAYGRARLIGCLHNTLFSVRNNLDRYGDTVLPRFMAHFARNRLGRAALLTLHRRKHARDLQRILETYDRFVMFADPNLEELRYFLPDFDNDKVALIPHSADDILPAVPMKERIILWVGRVTEHQKRAERVIPLWRALHHQLPEWTFRIVGEGPLLQELRERAEGEGLPRIEFVGRQPSRPHFERAAVYVMTSDFEAWGLTLTEAQSAGAVPVLFDTFPMASWLVQHGVAGVLVTPSDLPGMAEAIRHLCQDVEYRTQMAERALHAARRLDEAFVGDLWNNLLSELRSEASSRAKQR